MYCSASDPYRFEKIALKVAVENVGPDVLQEIFDSLSRQELEELYTTILRNGLEFFWLDSIQAIQRTELDPFSHGKFKAVCLQGTKTYLAQKKVMLEIDSLFAAAGISHAFFKGAQVREIVYAKPAYRPSKDIDLLISPKERNRALQLLAGAGYTLHFDPANVSHEVNMVKQEVVVDVHWDIMRPGRTRISLVEEFLERRQRYSFFWGLDAEVSLFIMLTHPVFTKYSTAPQSAVIRLVDIIQWLEELELEWSRLCRYLRSSGMITAAWITMRVVVNLTGRQPAKELPCKELPKAWKKKILSFWLARNLSTRFMKYPAVIKYIFTALAHDSCMDAYRFYLTARQERKQRKSTVEELESLGTGF